MKPLLCIVGATASGKSSLALELAQRLNGQIISCDSMQIYRGCDIVTAKATRDEQTLVRHHLLDVVSPDEAFSAASWARAANEVIKQIEARGQTPIVCGGTGFYLRALLEPETLAVAPPDFELRAQLKAELLEVGQNAMHARLASVAAAAAARLHPNDAHRVLRALEVAVSAPQEIAQQWPSRDAQVFALNWPRELLVERINERVQAMIEMGALDETRSLIEQFGDDAPALGSVGYKQLHAHLSAELSWTEAVEAWKIATRQYAKRQMTWFRGQTRASWLDATQTQEELISAILTSV